MAVEPRVDALHVEHVAALGQQADGVPVEELAQADGAGAVGGGVTTRGGVAVSVRSEGGDGGVVEAPGLDAPDWVVGGGGGVRERTA